MDILKPVTEPTIPILKTCEIDLYSQGEVVQTLITPKALILLHNLIKQDAYAEDKKSKQRLQRHIQKFVNAAQTSFTKGVLQQNQIWFLIRINNEAKVRRSTKSEILAKGEGKVMSYEDLKAA